MQPAFKTIERFSAADAVADELARLITSSELQAGEKLPSEVELARSFGVSRPVVREALGSLRGLGLVRSENGRGSFVAAARPVRALLGGYTVDELHEVRAYLEVPAAGTAAARRSPEQLAELERLVEALEACTDHDEWTRLDATFHVTLARATGNDVLANLIEHLRDLLVELSQLVSAAEGRIAAANVEHRAIFEAIAASDDHGARKAMSSHLHSAYVA